MLKSILGLFATVFFGAIVVGTILLGQWAYHAGPDWMLDKDGEHLGLGTFLAVLVTVVIEFTCWLFTIATIDCIPGRKILLEEQSCGQGHHQ